MSRPGEHVDAARLRDCLLCDRTKGGEPYDSETVLGGERSTSSRVRGCGGQAVMPPSIASTAPDT